MRNRKQVTPVVQSRCNPLDSLAQSGVWFVRVGGNHIEAAEAYRVAFNSLPKSARPQWIVVPDSGRMESRVMYDALIEAGLPVVRIFRGASLQGNQNENVMAR